MEIFARILFFACFTPSWAANPNEATENSVYTISNNGLVMSAFDKGFNRLWIGKVTTESLQKQNKTQHWMVDDSLGSSDSLKILRCKENTGNNLEVSQTPGERYPVDNAWNLTKIGNDEYLITQTFLKDTGKTLEDYSTLYDILSYGCIRNMGVSKRLRLAECNTTDERQKWSFQLV